MPTVVVLAVLIFFFLRTSTIRELKSQPTIIVCLFPLFLLLFTFVYKSAQTHRASRRQFHIFQRRAFDRDHALIRKLSPSEALADREHMKNGTYAFSLVGLAVFDFRFYIHSSRVHENQLNRKSLAYMFFPPLFVFLQ